MLKVTVTSGLRKRFSTPIRPSDIIPEIAEKEETASYRITGSRYSPKTSRKTPMISPRVAYSRTASRM